MKLRSLLICFAMALMPLKAMGQQSEFASEFIQTALLEDGKPIHLELLIRRPPGPGPFPVPGPVPRIDPLNTRRHPLCPGDPGKRTFNLTAWRLCRTIARSLAA